MGAACDAHPVVRDRVRHWSALAEDQSRRMGVLLSDGPTRVALGANDLSELVDNLIDNVFAHTPEGTDFEVGLLDGGDLVAVVVADRGPARPDDFNVERGRSAGPGSGLGLDIVRRLARSAGGDVTVDPARGGGTTVVATLRRAHAGTPV